MRGASRVIDDRKGAVNYGTFYMPITNRTLTNELENAQRYYNLIECVMQSMIKLYKCPQIASSGVETI
jgi:hypothetical protein